MEAIIKKITEQSIEITSQDKDYSLPLNVYRKYNLKTGDTVKGNVNFDSKRQLQYFEPEHPFYKIGQSYEFKIVDITTKENKNIIVVEDGFDNRIHVIGLKWQKKGIFTKEFLTCEVIDFKFGRPSLRNIDFTHPIYRIGQTYLFKFVGLENKTLKSGDIFEVIKLLGDDGCLHETPPIPSQCGHKFKPETLKCRVISISTYIKLEQVDFIDPYYSTVDNILNCERQLLNKYFNSLREKENEDPNIFQLFKQYDSNSSLWTITYCNKILPNIIISLANNLNFKEALQAIDILLKIETWILTSGFLDSFKRDSTKTEIKLKTENFIDRFKLIKIGFTLINSHNSDLNIDVAVNDRILVLGYYLRFNTPELLDIDKFFLAIISLLNEITIEKHSVNQRNVDTLILYIENQKLMLKQDEIENVFSIGTNTLAPFKTSDDLCLYNKYLIIQIYLLDSIGDNNRKNLYISELFKYFSYYFTEEVDRRKCLKHSFLLSNNTELVINLDPPSISNINNFQLLFDLITSNVKIESIAVYDKAWKEIIDSKNSKDIITVKLIRREIYGFVGAYNGINCILPKGNIESTYLKLYAEGECFINLSVEIIEAFNNFNTILIKELNPKHERYSCINLLMKELNPGDIIRGRIKKIESYGLFISTVAGEGLLHIKEITDLHLNTPLYEIFDTGEELNVCVLNRTEQRISFSLKVLAESKYNDEYKSIELRIIAPELNSFGDRGKSVLTSSGENKRRIFNQGNIFEFFSTIQYDFEGKIKYLKLAKVFYSGIQSSRSYFLNIYIAYFDILQDIENAIYDQSVTGVGDVVTKSQDLLYQLKRNTESLEKFPSIRKLINFLDILRNFNNTTEESFRFLSGYILNEELKTQLIFVKIAKVVLSNNLIISEQDSSEFMLKNLRIVFQYLKEGVFDISDNETEKKERELKERISKIRNMIINEESEKVEFKSSLIKPVLDTGRTKRLLELKKINDAKSKQEIDNLIGNFAKKRIIHSAMKTLVAFANSKGGSLFIGINDEGEFLGLKNDYEEIGSASRDNLGKRLDEYINSYIGNSFFGLLRIEFEAIEKKDIIIINVRESNEEVFLMKDENGNKASDFFIRRHSSSVKLDGKELLDYFKMRFNNSSA